MPSDSAPCGRPRATPELRKALPKSGTYKGQMARSTEEN